MEQGAFRVGVPQQDKRGTVKDLTAAGKAADAATANKQENGGENEAANNNTQNTGEDVQQEGVIVDSNTENLETTGDNKGIQGEEGISPDTQNEEPRGVSTPDVAVPENLSSLVDFMQETGGSIEDFVSLNKDVSTMSEKQLLEDFYKKTKPHLTGEDLKFYIEDKFLGDESFEDERTVKLKSIAYKEEIAKAKTSFEEGKQKYYKEIKANRVQVDPKQQEALDFFNRYNDSQKNLKQQEEIVLREGTEFLKGREGFEFDLGAKKVNYKYGDAEKLATNQSKMSSFVQKFVNKEGQVDYGGYHKAMFAANNADKLAKNFYEQGRADMAKEMTASGKNIDTSARTLPKDSGTGFTYQKLGVSSAAEFKIKQK